MLKETTLYTAVCDGCDADLMDSFANKNLFDSESSLILGLVYKGWHDTGNFHFCPNCHTIDENNEVKFTYKPQDNEQ